MSKSIELTIEVNPLWTEYVSDVLIEKIGCCGVVTAEEEYKDETLIKDSTGKVKGYLPFVEDSPIIYLKLRKF